MRLATIRVQGFRSLADIGPLEISQPMILVGHNDSGKTAFLDALSFLLGAYTLSDEDRTYLDTQPGPSDSPARRRVEETIVTGEFQLSVHEQNTLALPSRVRVRRARFPSGKVEASVELDVAEDESLRGLAGKKLDELRRLAKENLVDLQGKTRKEDIVQVLEDFAKGEPTVRDWVSLPAQVRDALPRVLRFGDHESAESAVRSALNARFQQHLEDPKLSEQVTVLQQELSARVREDAQGLVDHIKARCDELTSVEVKPEISFTKVLKATHLNLATADGEGVGVGRSGAGRARRVSLAVWEWASDALRDTLNTPGPDAEAAGESWPHDCIVIYDEPDTHLDYLQQRRIMKVIREQSANEHIGVVVATHSMNLIDGAEPGDIVHLRLQANNRTEIDSILTSDAHDLQSRHLMQIAAALGLRNTILLHERFFLGVEGDTEMVAFPMLFRLVTGRTLQSAGIVLVPCNKDEGAIIFAGHLVKHGRRVAFVVDGDVYGKKFYSETRLANAGLVKREHVHLLGDPGNEFEHEFSDEQWAHAGNTLWRRTDGRPWRAADIAELRSGPKFSAALEDAFRVNSDTGPSGKPATMAGLVRSLQDASEVPPKIQEIFAKITALAALDE
ncbi:AAA family ATPase [Micromonospora sp. CPCC 206060]|uniref:AAA family ATPase n=1 Tax=Micromonospora sp. CPCC 206060 TaxID=3122406 RepID=UPI002FF20FA4